MKKIFSILCMLYSFSSVQYVQGDTPDFEPTGPASYNFKQIIQIESPKSSDNWEEGTTQKIRWSKKHTSGKTVKIQLIGVTNQKVYEIGSSTNVPNIFGGGESKNKGFSEYEWKIPKDAYKFPGTFKIKIATVDDMALGQSEVFRLSMALKSVSASLPAHINNTWHRSQSNKSLSNLANSGIGILLLPYPRSLDSQGNAYPFSVPEGMMLVGYENNYSETSYVVTSTHSYEGVAFRGNIYFNLDDFYNRPGFLVKATLKMEIETAATTVGSGVSNESRSYAVKFLELAEPWKGYETICQEYFCLAPTSMGETSCAKFDGISRLHVNLTTIVRKWMNHKESNLGMMVVGPNENFEHNNNIQATLYKNITLDIEFIESDK